MMLKHKRLQIVLNSTLTILDYIQKKRISANKHTLEERISKSHCLIDMLFLKEYMKYMYDNQNTFDKIEINQGYKLPQYSDWMV